MRPFLNSVLLLVLLVCLACLAPSGEANSLPKPKTTPPGRRPHKQQHAGPKPIPRLEPKSYLHPTRFLAAFDSTFVMAENPLSFNSVYQHTKALVSSTLHETSVKNSIHVFFAALQSDGAKAEAFCHHLLASYAKELQGVLEVEAEPAIFAELWKTCAFNSFYRSAVYVKPVRRAEIQPNVHLEPMKDSALILPDDIFDPSALRRESAEVVRFIGESQLPYLVQSLTAEIVHTSLEKAPPDVQMKLFERLFVERPFDKKGVRLEPKGAHPPAAAEPQSSWFG